MTKQIFHLVKHYYLLEKKQKDRWLTPILFALIVLLLFSVAFSDINVETFSAPLFSGQTYLTSFFALQLCYSRVFEPDTKDGIFRLFLTYPISSTSWYLSKFIITLGLSLAISLPTLFMSSLFLGVNINLGIGLVLVLALIGMCSVGILISVMTMESKGKQVLFPILYFPLTIPVLICSLKATESLLAGGSVGDIFSSWLGMLLIFDSVYFTLGLLFFEEVIDLKN